MEETKRKVRTKLEQSILMMWRKTTGEGMQRARNVAARFNKQLEPKVTEQFVMKVFEKRYDTDPPRIPAFSITEAQALIVDLFFVKGLAEKEIYAHLAWVKVKSDPHPDIEDVTSARPYQPHVQTWFIDETIQNYACFVEAQE